MTIQDLGAIGELIGAIILIVSVVYLALQVRHASKVTAISGDLERRKMVQSWNDRIILNAEFSEIWQIGLKDPASLSPSDRARFDSHVHDAVANTQSVFINGRLFGNDPRTLVIATMRDRFKNWPFFSDWWSVNAARFHPDFKRLIDGVANEGGT